MPDNKTPIPKRRPGFPERDSVEAKEYKKWIMANHKAIEKQYGLPEGTLLVISAHESGFDPYALSHGYAKGAFQFTTTTARSFGLDIDGEFDERYDYVKSAHAAAKYMAVNMKRFGSFRAAISDWNGGGAAAQWVKDGKDPYEYVEKRSGNQELGKFLKGVQDQARELGFGSLFEDSKKPANAQEDQVEKINAVQLGEDKEKWVQAPQMGEENHSWIPLIDSQKKKETEVRVPEVAAPEKTRLTTDTPIDSFVAETTEKASPSAKNQKAPSNFFNQNIRRGILKHYSEIEMPLKINPVRVKIKAQVSSDPKTESKPMEATAAPAEKKTVFEMRPDLFKYKSGGRILQLSGDGKTVEAELKGKERIFSRPDTKRLMDLAKKAQSEQDFFLLGKFLYDATKKQDSREPDYVDA